VFKKDIERENIFKVQFKVRRKREEKEMESAFYPVITVENEEELEVLTTYCDERRIEFDFLDNNQDQFPARVLVYISDEDLKLFLDSIG
jgi:hypothetical protein